MREDYQHMDKGDSAAVKTLKVVKWALMRGGTFTPMDLRRRFPELSKATSYRICKDWRSVFGTTAPVHQRRQAKPLERKRIHSPVDDRNVAIDRPDVHVAAVKAEPPRAKVSLASLLENAP